MNCQPTSCLMSELCGNKDAKVTYLLGDSELFFLSGSGWEKNAGNFPGIRYAVLLGVVVGCVNEAVLDWFVELSRGLTAQL